MKQRIFTKLLFAFLFFAPQSAFAQTQNNAIDATGDIAFVAYLINGTNGMPGFAFVLLDNCPNGTSIGFTIDKSLTAGIQQLCQQEGTTLFMGLLAAFKV